MGGGGKGRSHFSHHSHSGHNHYHGSYVNPYELTPAQKHNYGNPYVYGSISVMHYERSGEKAYCPDGLWSGIINLNVIKTVVFGLVINPGTESKDAQKGGLTPSPLGNDASIAMVQMPTSPPVVNNTERYHENVIKFDYFVKKGSGDEPGDYVNELPLINFTGTFSGSPRYDENCLMQLLKKERAMSEFTFRALPKPWDGAEPTPEQVMQWLKDVVHPVYHEQLMWDASYWITAYKKLYLDVIVDSNNLQSQACLYGCCIFKPCMVWLLSPSWEADPEKYHPARCKLAGLEKAFFDKREARFGAKYIGVLVEGRPANNGLFHRCDAELVSSEILEQVKRADDSYVASVSTMER